MSTCFNNVFQYLCVFVYTLFQYLYVLFNDTFEYISVFFNSIFDSVQSVDFFTISRKNLSHANHRADLKQRYFWAFLMNKESLLDFHSFLLVVID